MSSLFRVVTCIIALLGAVDASAVSGEWKYTEMIYKGIRQPIPNPDLNLRWTFFSNGTDRLFWDRAGAPGFCERFAHFRIENGKLIEEVFASNPRNAIECSRDQDMQVGRKTENPVDISDSEIQIHLNLGDEELVYILTPVASKKIDEELK